MKSPIHSTKHYVQWTLFTTATVSVTNQNIAQAVAVVDKNVSTEVEEGAVIKAVYIELSCDSSAANGSQIFLVIKRNNNQSGVTYADSIALNGFVEKKNILHVHQGLGARDSVGNPITVFKGWIKIPKSKQRFGLGDTLALTISNPSVNDQNSCGFATYKEYT